MSEMTSSQPMNKSSVKYVPAQLSLDHVSPATLLLEKRRQMLEVQRALDAQNEEYERQQESFRQRENRLRMKDVELQESLIQFNKLLKDKYEKREKYDRLAQEEKKHRESKEKEIDQRKKTLQKLTEQRENLQNQVRIHEQYQDFLHRFQEENSSEWPEVESVLARYQALDVAYTDLLERQNSTILLNESLRNEFSNYTKEQMTHSLNLKNQLAHLQNCLERAEISTAARENEVDKKVQQQASRSRELSRIIMAVENLFQRCMHQSTVLNHSEHLKHADINSANDSTTDSSLEMASHEKANLLAARQKISSICARLDVIVNYVIDYESIAIGASKMNIKSNKTM